MSWQHLPSCSHAAGEVGSSNPWSQKGWSQQQVSGSKPNRPQGRNHCLACTDFHIYRLLYITTQHWLDSQSTPLHIQIKEIITFLAGGQRDWAETSFTYPKKHLWNYPKHHCRHHRAFLPLDINVHQVSQNINNVFDENLWDTGWHFFLLPIHFY